MMDRSTGTFPAAPSTAGYVSLLPVYNFTCKASQSWYSVSQARSGRFFSHFLPGQLIICQRKWSRKGLDKVGFCW